MRGSIGKLALLGAVLAAAFALAPSAAAAPAERAPRAAAGIAVACGPCPIVVFGKGNIAGTVEFRYNDGRPEYETCTVQPGGEGCPILVDEFSSGGVLRAVSPGSRGIECLGVTMSECPIRAGEQGSVCAAFTQRSTDPITPSPCPPPYVQAYKKGDGKGTITGTAPGRTSRVCEPTCGVGIWSNFQAGDVVTLTATATLGTFLRWEQCPTATGNTCTFTLTNTFPVCAVFVVSGPPTDPTCPQTTPSRPPQVDRPPNTRITAGPSAARATRSRRATFRFRSSEARSSFLCRLDRRPWLPCRSPKGYRNLKVGRHTFRVKAIDRTGKIDRTPAVRRWRIRA